MQPLLAKVVELELPREVPPDDVLHLLGHLWLVQVTVDLGERLDFLCKTFEGKELMTLRQISASRTIDLGWKIEFCYVAICGTAGERNLMNANLLENSCTVRNDDFYS